MSSPPQYANVRVARAMTDLTSEQRTPGATEHSADGINNEPDLANLKDKEKRLIKHVLDSGLVIEVESTGYGGVSASPTQFTSNGAITARTPSPESSDVYDSQSSSDDSVSICRSECDSIPPRQVDDDYYFEPSVDAELELQLQSNSLHGDDSGDLAETVAARASSPESPHDCLSDDPAMYEYHYPSEWDINPPRQGGDWFFEQSMDDDQSQSGSFYDGDQWRLKFIPTLLGFLGTTINLWEWQGDSVSFVSLLQRVWTTVYGTASWSEEDGCLVQALAMESITAWLASFGSDALDAVENYLKSFTNGNPSFSEWSVLCKEMVQDGRLFHENLGCRGVYRSIFVLKPLSRHMEAIRGGLEVQGLRSLNSCHESTFPFGAVGLAAAAALRAMMLFGMQFVAFDKIGNLVIEAPTHDDTKGPVVDVSFSHSTAGGTTRQFALAACSMVSDELRAVVALASTFALDPDHEEIVSGDKTDNT